VALNHRSNDLASRADDSIRVETLLQAIRVIHQVSAIIDECGRVG
jgi:hypothetical protein